MPSASQPSSDDGMAAALVQKIHSGMEKKRKEKEARYLAVHKKETSETIARTAQEFNAYCDEIDKTFEDFNAAYAKNEDEIRATWVKIIKAYAPFIAQIRELLAAEAEQETTREEQQVLGIAYQKKSEETLERIIVSLLGADAE
ncbi:hypothetical protein K439DRAFT_1629020 [Ramaria rubella]|nr:hypothetical protein K439DRAFT_1629020 [Ramaria rubella]